MSREETMTAAVGAFGSLVNKDRVWRGSITNFTRQIADLLGVHEYTIRRMLPSLRELGVISGPTPVPRAGSGGLQDHEWKLLKPGAVIVKTKSGFYAVQETTPE